MRVRIPYVKFPTVQRCSRKLTFQNLAVTVCSTSRYFQKFYILPTEYLYLLYVSQEKHRRFPYRTLNDWIL